MGEGVIADDVAGADDFMSEIGALLDVASDEKESCVNIMFGEDFEQAQSVRIVGTVVVGESDLASVVRKAGESFAVPLAGGGHGLVGRYCGGREGCGAGQGESEHMGIVIGLSNADFRFPIVERG